MIMNRKQKLMEFSKHNRSRRGKSGFTLAELSVVLAVITLITGAIVAFSVYVGGYMDAGREDYYFLDDRTAIEGVIGDWIAERDIPNADLSDIDGKEFLVTDGVIELPDGKIIEGLKGTKKISFEVEGDLVKCIITPNSQGSNPRNLVFALRCADTEQAEGGGAGE